MEFYDYKADPQSVKTEVEVALLELGLGSLEASFRRIALPRIRQIKNLAQVMSRLWWHKFSWMSEEARSLLDFDAKTKASSIKADYGY
ncbi:MAG: hypothetical protein ACE5IT_08415 [bacterium]